MDHYLEIRVLPDPEFPEGQLLSALFAKLHRRLGQAGEGQVGLSFPHHGVVLGGVVRLHGTEADLQALMADNWLQGMKDYTHSTAILPVPAGVSYRTVRRVQAKSAHNKRKRSIAKGWLSEEEALMRIPDSQQKPLRMPYIELRSLSNGNLMRVYVEHGPEQAHPQLGMFNAYGLSASATVPWF